MHQLFEQQNKKLRRSRSSFFPLMIEIEFATKLSGTMIRGTLTMGLNHP